MSDEDAIKWLEECATFFERRDDGGEDMAFWANLKNAENARKIAARLRAGKPAEGITPQHPGEAR